MGVIQRQSIKQTLVTFVGVGIGVISTLFIYPRATEIYGLFQVLFSTASLLSVFVAFGFNQNIVRFFPTFKNSENGDNGLLTLNIIAGIIGSVLLLMILPLLKEPIINQFFSNKSPWFADYFNYLGPLTILILFTSIFTAYISNYQRIVIPSIFNELLIKVGLPILVLLYLSNLLSLDNYVNSIIGIYILALFGLVIYLMNLGKLSLRLNPSFYTKPIVKDMGTYAFYGVLGGAGARLAFNLDIIMVGSLLDLGSAGVYTIALFIANILAKPIQAIFAITSPIISNAWKENNLAEIKMIYQKSSINLLIVGIAFMGLVWLSIDDLFSILPNGDELSQGKYVVLFLGLSKLVDMATSVNGQIIGYSKYFRFNFYTVLILAVLNIICNVTFIPMYGMVGAALATLLSQFIYNFIKYSYIKHKFKFSPFSKNTLHLILIGVFCFLFTVWIPSVIHPLFAIALRSIIFGSCYLFLVLHFNISEDFAGIFNKWKNKVLS